MSDLSHLQIWLYANVALLSSAQWIENACEISLLVSAPLLQPILFYFPLNLSACKRISSNSVSTWCSISGNAQRRQGRNDAIYTLRHRSRKYVFPINPLVSSKKIESSGLCHRTFGAPLLWGAEDAERTLPPTDSRSTLYTSSVLIKREAFCKVSKYSHLCRHNCGFL